jgi:hypothetical protein
MSFRPMSSQGPGRVHAVGMHNVSQATIREAIEDENVFAFVPPSTAEQQQALNARTGKFSSFLMVLNAKFSMRTHSYSFLSLQGYSGAFTACFTSLAQIH